VYIYIFGHKERPLAWRTIFETDGVASNYSEWEICI